MCLAQGSMFPYLETLKTDNFGTGTSAGGTNGLGAIKPMGKSSFYQALCYPLWPMDGI